MDIGEPRRSMKGNFSLRISDYQITRLPTHSAMAEHQRNKLLLSFIYYKNTYLDIFSYVLIYSL